MGKLLRNLYSIFKFTLRNQSIAHRGNNLLLTMPKDKPHTALLKTQRLVGKKKNQKYTPGNISLQVLGSGARGAPRSLYVFSDHSRYLFNCGEGAQRLAHEHKMKLSKLEHIFVTHLSWDNVGGLPGVALTIQDVGVPEITLHGPEGVDEIFNATRRFVILKNMTVKTVDCSRGNYFDDSVLKIQYVPLLSNEKRTYERVSLLHRYHSSSRENSPEDDTDYYAHERSGQRVLQKRKQATPDLPKRFAVRETDIAMCYIGQVAPRPGSLCLEKCVEAGVPPGPLLGRLKAGEDITLDSGVVVRSADVTLPDDPGVVFIVVEIPSEEFLASLEQENAFDPHFATSELPEKHPFIIVHFTPVNIMRHPIYEKWMSKFPSKTEHLLLNDGAECMGSIAVHRIQHKLNVIEPSIFPLLADKSIPIQGSSGSDFQMNGNSDHPEIINALNELKKKFSIIKGSTLWKAQLRPSPLIDSNPLACLTLVPKDYLEEVNQAEGFSEEYRLLESAFASLDSNESEMYPHIIFFGTGSCIPNKTRNTSAILLNISEEVSILLDCGEGTWGQIVRYYGSTASDMLCKLRAVYVSHLHADHHLGLLGLLAARQRAMCQEPLYLFAPLQISSWLDLYHNRVEHLLTDVILIPNQHLLADNTRGLGEIKEAVEAIGLNGLETCRVVHCPNSFGIALKHNNWKLTYSGDTMPSKALIELGKNSDVLIHEATMEDELESEAREKLHSTVKEAIFSGQAMGAKFTLLTHFSQRYAKLPRLDHEAFSTPGSAPVGIAFDNMKVRFCDLKKLPLMYPALKAMFQEDYDELETKALKRQVKAEMLQQIAAAEGR